MNYNPNTEIVFTYIDIFYHMIDAFNPKYINQNNYKEWLDAAEKSDRLNQGFPVCKKHKMLLTCF